MKIYGVIPSRYASSRFPGKPLAVIKGKTLIRRVWEQARKCSMLDGVIVATDDRRIASEVNSFGGRVVMTSSKCKSGTDRLAEVARKHLKNAGIIINIQGDEPLVPPALINALAKTLLKEKRASVATAVYPLKNNDDIRNPNIAKVVFSKDGYALYFSRSTIPFNRDGIKTEYFKHIGIYGYKREFLLRYSGWPQTKLEKTEQLEQLRILENGEKIKVIVSGLDSTGVDLPSDVKKIEKLLK
jgi:3-deoxy-manno-octulosonate cytidylyltransferase (CMP-KDO synthetase)